MAVEERARMILSSKGNIDVKKYTVKELESLLTWYNVKKLNSMSKEEKVRKWLEIKEKGSNPPIYERWTDDDEIALVEASRTDLEIGDTAVGRLEEKRKRDLMQAARHLSAEEWAEIAETRSAMDSTQNDDNIGAV